MIKMKLFIKTLILNFNMKKIVPYHFKTHKMNNSNQWEVKTNKLNQ